MFSGTANWSGYLYDKLKNLVDAEATYVSARQQSAKANLPKKVLSVADGVSFAVRGATAAVVLGCGAPLPITALVTLSLFPTNTFSYLATKINGLSNKFNKWLSSDEQIDDSDLYTVSYKNYFAYDASNKSDTLNLSSWVPSVKTLETVQYLVTNGLTFYQNLLPINWLKIMAVEAVEQPLRWYYGGALPGYYTKNAMSDWIWALSGVTGEMIQVHRLLNNTNKGSQQVLNIKDNSTLASNYLPAISLGGSHKAIKTTNCGDYLSVINWDELHKRV